MYPLTLSSIAQRGYFISKLDLSLFLNLGAVGVTLLPWW